MNPPQAAHTMDECDLLMKGGVTSGIVYPRLVERLARDYHFRNIGGTSAGAIAAAAAAAAELGRQSNACPDAFSRLGQLPDWLGTQVRGRSRLLRLFQPAARLRRHFEFALSLLTWRGGANAIALAAAKLLAPVLLGCLVFAAVGAMHLLAAAPWSQSWKWALATALPMALMAAAWQRFALRYENGEWLDRHPSASAPADWLGAFAFLAAMGAVVSHAWLAGPAMPVPALIRSLGSGVLAAGALGVWSAWAAMRHVAAGIRDNHFGACSGLTEKTEAEEALTDWLERYLASLGGIAAEAPLCFAHLWTASSQALDPAVEHDCDRDKRRIHLEMVTTALSQHTAYAIPFRTNAGTFYFSPSEWRRLFPKNVVDWLVGCHGDDGQPHPDTGEMLIPLARDGRLPVIVGVRMSLSFPMLLSAVPLFAVDFTDRDGDRGRIKRVWFSDGGIASNLPLQAFDALLPVRPVFTINLKEVHPAHPIGKDQEAASQRVFLPENNSQGVGRYWKPFDEKGDFAVVHFLGAIVSTMQRWRDEILFPYAAYRDRIAQISLRDDEGGLNLAMSSEQIRDLAASGEAAGEKFYRRFHSAAGGNGWANHQRLALLNLLGGMEIFTSTLHTAPQQAAWLDALQNSQLKKGTVQTAHKLLHDLAAIGAGFNTPQTQLACHAGKPRPQLRLTPDL